MSLEIIGALLFFSISFLGALLIGVGKKVVFRFRTSMTELFERFFSSQFLFFNASTMFYFYSLVLFVAPIGLWWIFSSWFFSVGAVLIILVFPRIAFSIMEIHRRKMIVNALPDVLQQLSGALRAGATFNMALDALVSEREGPIAQEFSLVLREQRLGTRLDDSLENLGDRVKSEDMDIVVSAILIAQDVGGNLAEVLNRLAETLRSKISMEERIQSLTAQGVMQGYVVTALPTFIVLALVVVERKAIMPLFTSLLGWIFLTIIITLQILGGWFIRKIVQVDI